MATETRRRIALVGVVVAVLAILALWVFTVGADLTKPGESSSLFVRIRASLRSVFSDDLNADVPAEVREFETLDERLFPNAPQ